ncbi:MarR family transcriptional regulator [Planctomonas sp. JC2975]|uniref:MarR family winged helix-turn-helix transcriptional regulator n=1 Tax=Planctomonas sp. JC2975 TaxID=2729626 RepID=UPI001475E97A|nr:MarR family transcriptional regulator [Planctomonas sp. JC2975]NNC12361.1 MarR family transcriptional regulator [Planctomonas sp. JC2975]
MSDADRRELMARLTDLGAQSATMTALFQQRAAAGYGVGVTDMKALDLVMREGGKTAGQLAEALGVTSGAVTGVIDRLEKHGMARRTADSADRRRVLVVANLERLAAGPNVYQGIGEAFARLHDSYSDEELAFLARYLQDSIDITKDQIDKLG